MTNVMDNPSGSADNVIEVSEKELEALRETARDADGRKSEVQLARDVHGVY